MSIIHGSGPYGRIRSLLHAIKADQNYLDNGPLGPIQKKRLKASIDLMREELKKERAQLRTSKNNRPLT